MIYSEASELVDEVIYKDILVIGGGVAGMTAAIEASKQGVDVLLVNKGIVGKSGASCFASSLSYSFPFDPPDSVELALKDFVIGENYYLIDQEIAKAVLTEAQSIGRYLETMGILWRRHPDGSLYQDARKNIKKGMVYSIMRGETGKSVLDVLRDEILHKEIDLLEETAATSLLTLNGEAAGATALDYLNGKFIVIQAKSVILATGPGGNFWTYCTEPKEQTGDGLAMAYRVGAELIGIEMNRYWLSAMKLPESWTRISGAVSSQLATQNASISPKFYNSRGQQLKLPGDQAARIMALYKETGTLREGLYCSYRDADIKLLEDYWYYLRYLKKLGIDLTKDLIECQVIPHTMCGGVRVNVRTETNVPGLYCTGGIAGIYIADTGLVNSICLGRWSADYASKRAQEIEKPEFNWQQIEKEEKRVFSLLIRKDDSGHPTPAQIKKRIREIMWNDMHFMKNRQGMEAALIELQKIRKEAVPKMQLATDTRRYNYGLVEALEVMNMLDVCELIIKVSLFRRESRGTFQREDYPEIDNKNWLKNIIVKLEGGEPKMYTVPVNMTYFKLEDDDRSPEEKSKYIPCVWKE